MATSNIISPAIIPLLRRPIVEKLTGKPRATFYRDIQKGLMTRPIGIGGGRSAWPANEIEAINKARIAGKTEEEIKALVKKLEAARSEA